MLANLGYFNDALSEEEKFATYDQQFVWRLAYLPVVTEKGPLAHLAVMGREAEPDEGQFQAKSKPEDFLAPNFVDTGKFDSDHARTLGFEAFYRDGPWLVGGEYGWQSMDAPASGDPMFHGGNIAVDWLITGETRGYNLASGFFKNVVPKKTVFEGGPGAWKLALNYSYIDLDDGNLTGGKFWRISPRREVAPAGLQHGRAGLWLRSARSIRPRRQDPLLPFPPVQRPVESASHRISTPASA